LNRIEKAKVTPDEATITKIDHALKKAAPIQHAGTGAVARRKAARAQIHVVGRPAKPKISVSRVRAERN
jgi:hypothetical protein